MHSCGRSLKYTLSYRMFNCIMSHVSLFVTLQSPDPSLHPAAAQSSVSQAPGSGHFSAGDGNTSVADKLADTQHAAAAVTELAAAVLLF